jgi:transcriptional regulator with XRE-family HTH domain
MRQEHVIARLLRAVSGKTQEQIAEEIGVHPSLIAQFELGKVLPSLGHLERMAKSAGITLGEAEGMLRLFETLQRPRSRRGDDIDQLLAGMQEEMQTMMKVVYQRMLGMPIPGGPPRREDRKQADELFRELEKLPQEDRLAVVQSVREFQSWIMLERVCVEVEYWDIRHPDTEEGWEAWVQVAHEIAAHIEGPEEWRDRVQQYAREQAVKMRRSPSS